MKKIGCVAAFLVLFSLGTGHALAAASRDQGGDARFTQDPNERTVLMNAALQGSAETVKYHLDRGAAVDARAKDGKTALMYAAQGGDAATIKVLLDAGANLEARQDAGWTPLMFAAASGQARATKFMRENGAAVNAQDKQGLTPLMLAAFNGQASTVKDLLSKGSEVNPELRDKHGRTAVMLAVGNKKLEAPIRDEALKSLVQGGADINAADKKGRTPLMTATIMGDADTLKTLLRLKADPNQGDGGKETPLMRAVRDGNLELAEALLEARADVRIGDLGSLCAQGSRMDQLLARFGFIRGVARKQPSSPQPQQQASLKDTVKKQVSDDYTRQLTFKAGPAYQEKLNREEAEKNAREYAEAIRRNEQEAKEREARRKAAEASRPPTQQPQQPRDEYCIRWVDGYRREINEYSAGGKMGSRSCRGDYNPLPIPNADYYNPQALERWLENFRRQHPVLKGLYDPIGRVERR